MLVRGVMQTWSKLSLRSCILQDFAHRVKTRYTPMDTKNYQLPDPTWQWVKITHRQAWFFVVVNVVAGQQGMDGGHVQ